MAHWAENHLFVSLSSSVQLLLFIFQIKVVQCFDDTRLLALVNCILDFDWYITLYAQIWSFGMGKKRSAWNSSKGETPKTRHKPYQKKTGWFVLSILLCLRCFRSGYPFLPIPMLCCFNPFTYYESKVFEHQYEISFLPLSVFLYNCWLSKGICTCPCAFCLTLDACTTKWLCSCRHFCVCVQIFRAVSYTHLTLPTRRWV